MKLCHQNKKTAPLPENLMLVDYYCSSKSTVGGGGHYELVLSSREKTETLRLDRYIKEDEDTPETKTSFFVPPVALDECMEIIQRHNLASWNDMENPQSTDGAKIVCKFWDGKKHIRVSNENMPENGEEIMQSIRNVMEKYLNIL